MFRSLYESFQDASGAPDDKSYLTNYFNQAVPAPLPATLPASQLASPIPPQNIPQMDFLDRESTRELYNAATANAVGGQIYMSADQNPVDRFNSLRVPGALIAAQQKCKSLSYDDVLAGAPDRKQYGCGWIVKPEDIKQANSLGKPFLGVERGPLNVLRENMPEGRYYWDMDKLQREMGEARAKTVLSCDSLKLSPYKNELGWCLTNAKAIPIDNQGRARYTNSFGQPECDSSRIILENQTCPRDVAATGNNNGPTVETDNNGNVTKITENDAKTGQLCEDNALSRGCVIQNIRKAGCSDGGALIQALSAGLNPRDYLGDLKNNTAFLTYQAQSPIKLNDSVFQAGNDTMANSLDNFKGLHSQANAASATDARVTGVGFAAIDLCFAKGKFQEYDRCDEYTDSTPPPYDLDCLQKAFKMAGGQGEGAKYPRQTNVQSYAVQFPTWGNVLAYFRKLKEDTSSQDIRVQEAALRDLMGIKRQSLSFVSISKVNAYEVYNFASVSTSLDIIFTGRRVVSSQELNGYKGTLPNFFSFNSPDQYFKNLSPSFVIVMDLRPENTIADPRVQFGFSVKDGVVLTVNKDMTNYQSELISTRDDEMRNNKYRNSREFVYNKECTTLNPAGNNRLKVYWNNKIATDVKGFAMFWSTCNPNGELNTPQIIPNDWISLTQGRYAPLLSFRVNNNGLGERRLPEFFPVVSNSVIVDMAARDANPAKLAIARFTGPSSEFRVVKVIMASAFNSISLCFRITQPVSSSTGDLIFSFGSIGIFARTGNMLTTLVGDKTSDFMYEQGKWYYMLLDITGGSGALNTGLKVSVYPVERVAAGDITLNESVNNMSINSSNPIFRELSDANVITLGKNKFGGSEFNSAVMDVAWLNVFDYSFSNLSLQEIKNRLQRDANGSWPVNWY